MNRNAVLLALALPACADTGADTVDVPLVTRGVAPRVVTAGDWDVELTSAELAFGPLYLCAGNTAGDLCDAAVLEWLDTAVVELLDPADRPVGTLEGSTGTVRSWMYDLGIASVLTESVPVTLAAAESLGGNSVVLEGVAQRDDETIRFRAAIPLEHVEPGIPLVRKSTNERFAHEVTSAGRDVLHIEFDPHPWVETVDFDALPRPDAASTVTAPIPFEPDTQPYRAVRNAVESGPRPVFSWTLP